MLPSGKMPGGAPMNVAFHLNNFGLDSAIISRIGTDDLGDELLDFMQGVGPEHVPRAARHQPPHGGGKGEHGRQK